MNEYRMVGAREVADRLGVSTTTAYTIIRRLNRKMEARGLETIPGKVSNEIFEATYFVSNAEGDAHER
jgi:transposase